MSFPFSLYILMKLTNLCLCSLLYVLQMYISYSWFHYPPNNPSFLSLSHPLLLTGWAGYVTHLCLAHVATAIIDRQHFDGLNITIDPVIATGHTSPTFQLRGAEQVREVKGNSALIKRFVSIKRQTDCSARHGSSPVSTVEMIHNESRLWGREQDSVSALN